MSTAASPVNQTIPAAAYVDAAGHALLRDSIVGFLDILGFSQAIRVADNLADAQQLVDRIRISISDSRQFVRQNFEPGFAEHPNRWAVKFFSDNLVVGLPVDENDISLESASRFVIRCAQRYQISMALNGFFLRGALARGPICLTDDIIFGSALLECYQLESKASIVPRVILANPLMEVLVQANRKSNRKESDPTATESLNSICRDIDGWWFVSYLEAATQGATVDWSVVERHKQSILKSLTGVTGHDVLPKYGWACRYHNMFCHWYRNAPGYSDQYRIDRNDETSLLLRLGDTL